KETAQSEELTSIDQINESAADQPFATDDDEDEIATPLPAPLNPPEAQREEPIARNHQEL
ncbi:hypothetical protein C0993_001905, partial [Termitomyces sp. T159_Od127]